MKTAVNVNVSGNSGIFITPEQLYEKLGITICQQSRWRSKKAKNRMPFYRQGKYIRYKYKEVVAWYEDTFKMVEHNTRKETSNA